ncbi:hypothetical protein TNCV_1659701 [Trichonephila clavipes]|nr:hypothetical protein TNCV_1659701 [Trichonephila clavipes]
MLDVELQRKWATELFRQYICSSELPPFNETMEATREIARENSETTREMDETMEATREMNRDSPQKMDETMEVGEMADGENGIEAGEDQMAGGENGIEAVEDENAAVENYAGWENLFQVVNESAFKSYFNNEQGEILHSCLKQFTS